MNLLCPYREGHPAHEYHAGDHVKLFRSHHGADGPYTIMVVTTRGETIGTLHPGPQTSHVAQAIDRGEQFQDVSIAVVCGNGVVVNVPGIWEATHCPAKNANGAMT